MQLHLQAEQFRQKGLWEKAAETFRQAIVLNPNFSWSHNGLGECLLRLDHPEAATQCLRRFAEMNSGFVWAYRNLGESLERQENWKEAIQAYSEALKIEPESLDISQRLSYAKWRQSHHLSQYDLEKVELSDEADLGKSRARYRSSSSEIPFSVDSYLEEVEKGISLVTCCMNRNENLIKALKTWIQCNEISQIVIVDWNSDNSVKEEIDSFGIFDSRILIVRVNDQPKWILSYAFNLGFRVAGYDKILKTDADIMISPSFFDENRLEENTFLSGDWRIAQEGQEHINGFFFVRRSDLFGVQCFNEYITTYGWEDKGIKRISLNSDSIFHIPHCDSQRMGGKKSFNNALEEISHKPEIKSICNRYIASLMPHWDHHRFFVPFEVTALQQNYIEIRQPVPSYHQVPAHVREDAEYYGLCTALSWTTELLVYSIPKKILYSLLVNRSSSTDVTRMDVRLAACTEKLVNWYAHTIVLYFENDVSVIEGTSLVEQVIKLAKAHKFTVFVEPRIYTEVARSENSGLQPILQIPEGFYTHDLVELSPDVLPGLVKTFQEQPAFWLKIGAQDIPEMMRLLKSSAVLATQQTRFYIHAQHGLGNRLRAFASAMSIARKSGRELVLIWEPDNHCECEFGDLFEYDGKVLTSINEIEFENMDCYSYMEIEPNSCKDEYIPLNEGRDIYIRSAYVINNEFSSWEEENQILRELEPVAEVKALIRGIEVSGRVGIHIRMQGSKGTDKNSYDASYNWLEKSHQQLNDWRKKSHYSSFIKRIDYLLRENQNLKFFLAADTEEAYTIFVQRYSDRVSYLKRACFDRSKNQLYYALADALLLSNCSCLLGSTWSSFTELSQRFSTTITHIEMSGVDF
jgi:hypothetical protein